MPILDHKAKIARQATDPAGPLVSMRQVPSHRRCIYQENIFHFQFTECFTGFPTELLMDNVSECPPVWAIECYSDDVTESPLTVSQEIAHLFQKEL